MRFARVGSIVVVALGLAMSLAIRAQSPPFPSSDGREIFRFDTYDDEQLWTDVLRMQEPLSTVTPATALAVGLKVDVDALPPAIVTAIRNHQINVNDPAVTLQLLNLNAVVGIAAKVTANGRTLQRVGITCALCHSTVDNSLAQGIGHRLDGWPNRDLNVGAIVALSPALPDNLKAEFNKWGPGRYDPRRHIFDGTSIVTINTPSLPVEIPPAYGLQGVGFETYTADGPISYWNSYVGVTQMGGHGSFSDSRIGVTVTQKPDRVTPELPALLAYQLSLPAPAPPAGSFDPAAAARGKDVFDGVGRCSMCHIAPTYTDVLSGPDPKVPFLHPAVEVGMDPGYANRTATRMYRTSPLKGIWQHPPYFHDGSAADLMAVVNHYNTLFELGLSPQQKADLVAFLKSL